MTFKEQMKIFLFAFFFVFILLISSCVNLNPAICDGFAYNFAEIHNGTGDLEADFHALVDDNTEILQNCKVLRYRETSNNHMKKILTKYSLKEYNVSYSCEAVSFSILLYSSGNQYFEYYGSMGPCGKEKVNFWGKKLTESTGKYGMSYSISDFEHKIVEKNLNNFEFCVYVDQQTGGIDRYNGDSCNFIQSKSQQTPDLAIAYCDKIIWMPTKADCYRHQTDYLWRTDPLQANQLCNKLNQSIPQQSSYKYKAEECFQ